MFAINFSKGRRESPAGTLSHKLRFRPGGATPHSGPVVWEGES